MAYELNTTPALDLAELCAHVHSPAFSYEFADGATVFRVSLTCELIESPQLSLRLVELDE